MKILLIFISFILGLIESRKISNRVNNIYLSYFWYILIESLKVLIPAFLYYLCHENDLMLPALIFISLLAGSIKPDVPIYCYAPIIPFFTGSLLLSPRVFLILILLYISISLLLKEYLLAFLVITAVSPFIFILTEKSIPYLIFGMLSAELFYLKYRFDKP